MTRFQKQAISFIEKKGILVVFPIKGKTGIPSLWHEFYPRVQMKWEWNEDSDDRISKIWILMKELSEMREVVYAKWYQGRATFFSRDVFTAMLALINQHEEAFTSEPPEAELLKETLDEDSPLSTKTLKKLTDLQGRDNSGRYSRGLNWLFSRLQIVGFGEADDGAFPSLVVGSTSLIYEDLWRDSQNLSHDEATEVVNQYLPERTPFRKFFNKILNT